LESYEVIQSLINREKSVERAREYKNIAAESNAKGRSQYEAGRKQHEEYLSKQRSKKDYIQYDNQRKDIGAPTDKYCVYTTAWNAYKAMYKLSEGIDLDKDQAKLARANALKARAIKKSGYVNSFYDLASSFNETFGTHYSYKYVSRKGTSVPDDLFPVIHENGVDMPFVRFDHVGFAHTTNSIGSQKVFDVWHDRIEHIGGMVVEDVKGYDPKIYGSGCYIYGYHIYRK